MPHQILLQPALSAALMLFAFFAMIWPGYAVLHVLGYGRHRWPAATFAGPPVTLALLVLAVSNASWLSIPISKAAPAVWAATFALAVLGLALRYSVAHKAERDDDPFRAWLWLAIVAVPFLIMPETLSYGVGLFSHSRYPDAWSYVAVADYLLENARGAEGQLSALHQYASHLREIRNASSSLLAFLADGFRGARVDEAMSPLCMLILFANACALAALAAIFRNKAATICLVALAAMGWPANVVLGANFDHLLLLPMLPAMAAITMRAADDTNILRPAVIIGILLAAAGLAYVEIMLLGVAVAFVFAARSGPNLRLIGIACGAILLACALDRFALANLFAQIKSQYVSASAAARPGDGMFPGVGYESKFPDVLWTLGGEFSQTAYLAPRLALGLLISGVAALGVWAERRRWTAILAVGIVAAAFCYFAYIQHYPYGAYKILSVNFWLIGFFAVSGGLWLMRRLDRPRLRLAATAVIVLSLVSLEVVRIRMQYAIGELTNVSKQYAQYREATIVSDIIGDRGTLYAVRDDIANEWGMFYLSKSRILISPYRRLVNQPHVLPLMQRAAMPALQDIRYVITDRDASVRADVKGARPVWDGAVYTVWEIERADWSVSAQGGPHTDQLAISARGM